MNTMELSALGRENKKLKSAKKALSELLEAIELIEDMTFTRDLLPHESEAIWNDAVTRAKEAIK